MVVPNHYKMSASAITLGWSHTTLMVSEWYAHLLQPIHYKVCSKELRAEWYIYIYLRIPN